MADLRGLYCDATNDVRALLSEGRLEDAKTKAAEYLRDGVSTRPFLTLVADELLARPVKLGRPTGIRNFLEIGERFEDLRRSHVSHETALDRVAEEFHRGRDAIEKIVRKYRAAWAAAHEE